jgi:4-hydroxy-4-methyl-2-oxoglutarate aldolase
VIDFRVSIEIEGVRIAPGDLIFGDREGFGVL